MSDIVAQTASAAPAVAKGFSMTTLFGGTALFATIAMAWDKVRLIFTKFYDLFFESYTCGSDSAYILMTYLLSDQSLYKSVSIKKHSLATYNLFVKPYKDLLTVPFLTPVFTNGILFRKGMRFLFIRQLSSQNTNPTPRLCDYPISLSFIRGTVDFKSLVKEAYRRSYKQRDDLLSKKSQQASRFSVTKFFGAGKKIDMAQLMSSRESGGQSGDAVNTPSSPKKASYNTFSARELKNMNECDWIGFSVNDLGYEDNHENAFSHLAFPNKDVDLTINELEVWKENKEWFLSRKLPWRRGVLIHGQPGTGKSSFVKALAQHLNLPVYLFDIGTMDNIEFNKYWEKAVQDSPCLILVEDIDAVFNGRENVASKDGGLSFDSFLNTVSGVGNSDGVLLVVTTNHIEKLDPAIGIPDGDGTESTRPGRVDRVLKLEHPDVECRTKIAKRILDEWPELIKSVVESGEGDTGAQFQERCGKLAMAKFWEKHKRNKA